ncbi:Glycosyl transferase [Cinnamomum micranthum f. kanehirae]|uniref:Glycosyl transferase n=1 Tax=Cinnamomum micranthum f. kanehirae TaxID=337451 RepID=A0A3S3N883_9MAGN|nr:Glycosyl transferase [Cinnamomum micranthum f. kanehirae]
MQGKQCITWEGRSCNLVLSSSQRKISFSLDHQQLHFALAALMVMGDNCVNAPMCLSGGISPQLLLTMDSNPLSFGRYLDIMLPEIEKKDWRKGAQWFSMKRQHALLVFADSLYYLKFKNFCKPGMERRNCYSDEHYLPTLFHMIDPSGITNWSVTYVDWSERKWHPKSYRA